ncbi:hypothetical protein CSM81_23820, partial [Salmonella enterica subsp. enterica serovar Infantis]|nr:hypothetical protein [Salmonella enterica subsp. enterica serovar Infantis]
MNKIYKLKFDRRRHVLVVVSEITAGTGKEKSTGHSADPAAYSSCRKLPGTLTLLAGFIISLFPWMALANPVLPTGGQIMGGQGSISTSGNQMTIHQQTQNMVTNWHSFDIGRNNTVQFVQPGSSSVALNRVTGASGSQIMGTLKANGQVFILNPNGVLFGKDARVNVAGLVASTKNISNADFMQGHYTLSGNGHPGAQVVNQGSLTTLKGGYIVLAGERVSNRGTVTTPSGKTVLAAGQTVTLQLDNGGLTSVSVNGSVVNALVENRGLISATSGQVYLTAKGRDMLLNTVVNNSGTVEAKGLESRGGEIVLNGGDSGVVSQSGRLLADSQAGQGGKVSLEGQNIHLAANSLTSAIGKTGGGEVYVGGGWQGRDPRIKNASKVVMDKAATVDVSATESGNGGTAVLWSDDYTNFRGSVLAKGGAQSGNGGRVETSSHRNLQASGSVDASARAGRGGEWLLDPTDVTIVGVGTDSGIRSVDAYVTDIFTPTASDAQILNTSIERPLNADTHVTVQTAGADAAGQDGNITVNADIHKTAGGDAALTLLADRNIVFSKGVNVSSTSGALSLDLLTGMTTDNSGVQLGTGTLFSLNGGDFTAGSAMKDGRMYFWADHADGGKITARNISITATGTDPTNADYSMSTSGLGLSASEDITLCVGALRSRSIWGHGSDWSAGGYLNITSSGGVRIEANDTKHGGGNGLLSGAKGVSITTTSGDIAMFGTGNKGDVHSSIAVSSSEGDVSLSAEKGTVSLAGSVVDDDRTMGVTATKGNIILSGNRVSLEDSRLSAQHDVNLTATGGGISVKGGDSNAKAGVTSTDGIITVNAEGGGNAGLEVVNADFSAGKGIRINATSHRTGVSIKQSDFTGGSISLDGTARSGGYGAHDDPNGGVVLSGDVLFRSTDGTTVNAKNLIHAANYGPPVALLLTSANVKFDGGGRITATGSYAGIVSVDQSNITTLNRNLTINAVLDGEALSGPTGDSGAPASGAVAFDNFYAPSTLGIRAEGGDITINADSSADTKYDFAAFAAVIPQATAVGNQQNGFIFSGDGNISVTGRSGAGDAINVRLFNNENLTGHLTLVGDSRTGTGVNLDQFLDVQVSNADIHGRSLSGTGVKMTANAGNVNLQGNKISGDTQTGTGGISLSGSNVSITGGTLTGSAHDGKGAGVVVSAGENFTIDGVNVIGNAVNGDGIRLQGNLSANNSTVFNGTSSGSGNGVMINGVLGSSGGVDIRGTAAMG